MPTPRRAGPHFLLPVDSRLIKGMTDEEGPACTAGERDCPDGLNMNC
jgi:hypothetical protein